jgi:hypothetical protein
MGKKKEDLAVVEAEGTTIMMELDPGQNALDILTKHAESAPYDPGFMPIKMLKGSKSFNAGALGTLDSPIQCIIMSVNHRRGLWPPEKGSAVAQVAAALECMPDDIGKYNREEIDSWRGTLPLCGSSNNGGTKGALSKLLDSDTPEIIERFVSFPSNVDFVCSNCKWNLFGSDYKGGAGKACKETRMLLLYFIEEEMAATLSITPSSLRNWKNYKTSLPRQNFSGCFTKILTSPITKDGNEFNIVEFEPSKEGGSIVPVLPEHVASLGELVTYGGRECYKLEALIAEFLNIQLEDDKDYEVDNSEVDTGGDVPFDAEGEDF